MATDPRPQAGIQQTVAILAMIETDIDKFLSVEGQIQKKRGLKRAS